MQYYMICSTPRTGSSLLCSLLRSTKCLGVPAEYFEFGDRKQKILDKLDRRTAEELDCDFEKYIKFIKQRYSSSNGVFGFKIHQHDFTKSLQRGLRLDVHFPDIRVLYCRRLDIIRQAISWVRAIQTQSWSSHQAPRNSAAFDGRAVCIAVNSICDSNLRWELFFRVNSVMYKEVVYEHFVDRKNEAVFEIMDFFGVPSSAGIARCIQTTMQRQCDSVTECWYEKLLEYVSDQNQSCVNEPELIQGREWVRRISTRDC
ncbi:Stf0 family sulfotransferase [Novipirellula sp. SH528]|uniref:Stf0 family sulfotransferase n=1 Tax=Novipirellula sp. SH528 TaxID=3454466 RepID=UPI003F9EC9E3